MTRLTAALVGFVALAPLVLLSGCGSGKAASSGSDGQHARPDVSSSAATSSTSPTGGSDAPSDYDQHDDELFLSKIRSDKAIEGFSSWTDSELLGMARGLCGEYESGRKSVEDILSVFTAVGIDEVHGFYFIADASEVYCPALYNSVKEVAGL